MKQLKPALLGAIAALLLSSCGAEEEFVPDPAISTPAVYALIDDSPDVGDEGAARSGIFPDGSYDYSAEGYRGADSHDSVDLHDYNAESSRPQGSVNLFDYDTALITVFVGDFTEIERKYASRYLGVACDYLNDVAVSCGKSGKIICPALEYEFPTTDLLYSLDYSAPIVTEGDTAFNAAREAFEAELPLETLMTEYGTDSYGILYILHDSAGAPMTYNYYGGGAGYTEYCLIPYADGSGALCTPFIYAHELCHLFGAFDLYEENYADGVLFEVIEYAAAVYSPEIMLCDGDPYAKDRFTEVGYNMSDITKYAMGLIGEERAAEITELFPSLKREAVGAFR